MNLNADLLDGLHEAAFPKLASANTFAGNQTINGKLTMSGALETTNPRRNRRIWQRVRTVSREFLRRLIRAASACADRRAQPTETRQAFGGDSFATSGTGVFGQANPTSGATFGVQGHTFSPDGVAVVFGSSNAKHRILGRRSRPGEQRCRCGRSVLDNIAGGNILWRDR